MKKSYLKLFAFMLMIFTVLSTQSCNSDPCSDIDCGDNGVCIDGSCVCGEGWMGANCSTLAPTDPCEGISCSDNGTCVNGDCICNEGWMGVDCSTPAGSPNVRDAILGTWNVSETCSSDSTNVVDYISEIIVDSTDEVNFFISNIRNFGSQSGITPQDATVLARITTQNGNSFTFTFPEQAFTSYVLIDYSIIVNSGSYDADNESVTLNYTLTNETDNSTDDCEQIYTR